MVPRYQAGELVSFGQQLLIALGMDPAITRTVAETSWLARACRGAEPMAADRPVRLPGQTALANKQRGLQEGLALEPEIMPTLTEWAARLGVAIPAPFSV